VPKHSAGVKNSFSKIATSKKITQEAGYEYNQEIQSKQMLMYNF
jgi:hypothetical protein